MQISSKPVFNRARMPTFVFVQTRYGYRYYAFARKLKHIKIVGVRVARNVTFTGRRIRSVYYADYRGPIDKRVHVDCSEKF